jgi:hypothetical protein
MSPKGYIKYLLILVLILFPINSAAKRGWDEKAIITLRDNQPCFSYPPNGETRKRPYAFDYLAITKAGPRGGAGGWVIQLASYDKKIPVEPNSPKTCIKYGALPPMAAEVNPVSPLEFDTPYRAYLSISTASGSEIRYASDFCLIRNSKGEVVLTGVDWEHTKYAPHCLKPGESTKRSFWRRLFGK